MPPLPLTVCYEIDVSLRPLRLRPLPEIRRRSNDRHADVRPDVHRNHVLRHQLAGVDAGKAFGDDIGQSVVDDDVEMPGSANKSSTSRKLSVNRR